jgi:hypothetical protein
MMIQPILFGFAIGSGGSPFFNAPAPGADLLPAHIFDVTFISAAPGTGAALSWILFLIILAVTLALFANGQALGLLRLGLRRRTNERAIGRPCKGERTQRAAGATGLEPALYPRDPLPKVAIQALITPRYLGTSLRSGGVRRARRSSGTRNRREK